MEFLLQLVLRHGLLLPKLLSLMSIGEDLLLPNSDLETHGAVGLTGRLI